MAVLPGARAALLVLALMFGSATAAVADASSRSLQLLAISPSSPWTLSELEAAHADLVSYEPETGIAYVAADPAEEARLVAAGFRVATAEPDLLAGLRALQGAPDLGLYHTYEEMVAVLDSFATLHADVCRLSSLGKTLENRNVWALKISDDPDFDDPDEPDVLVVGCHHAREFMSVEVPLDLARMILEGRSTNPRLAQLVATRELWIVPMLNPDGHVYQEQFQAGPDWFPPGWRKNRRPNFDGSYGVDLNRNYGYLWGVDDEGSSPDPVSEAYRGSAAFSEPETRCLAGLIERQRFVISISYHSYGHSLLYPWGYTSTSLPEDGDLFAALADSMVRENGYRPGNAYYGTIYRTNGDLDDWAYGELSPRKTQRTLAFTTELNTANDGGFWPPDALIEPTCQAMRSQNLFALEAAGNPRAPLPPPRPVLAGSQDPVDGRRIHLQWTQPLDPANPVDHWEVFELSPSGLAGPVPPAELHTSGRVVLVQNLPRPPGGLVVLRLDADLLPLWDYAYVEARVPGGEWTALVGDRTRSDSPTGYNSGNGWTGPAHGRLDTFDLGSLAGPRIDLALRLEAYPDRPRPALVRASLDVSASYEETRRILDPDVHQPSFDFVAQHAGIFAYGVTAVDPQGQRSESNLLFFVVPTVAVQVSDVECWRDGDRITLRWRDANDGGARFEAWCRDLGGAETPAERSAEWVRGDYALAAQGAGAARLEWRTDHGRIAVLLRSVDADGERLWGPWVVESALDARAPLRVPNPFVPGAACVLDLAVAGVARLDVVRVDGRIVRSLVDGPLVAGPHHVAWDGRDATGQRVAAGVYVIRLRTDRSTVARRAVILPSAPR
jgi:Zinc carboxypeptidase/FlgD Ig-like domain